MDFLIGITGKDFVLMAADSSQARSIVVMKKGAHPSHPHTSAWVTHAHLNTSHSLPFTKHDEQKSVQLTPLVECATIALYCLLRLPRHFHHFVYSKHMPMLAAAATSLPLHTPSSHIPAIASHALTTVGWKE
jgi:hypothetical protein